MKTATHGFSRCGLLAGLATAAPALTLSDAPAAAQTSVEQTASERAQALLKTQKAQNWCGSAPTPALFPRPPDASAT